MKIFVKILSMISAYGIERNVVIFRISTWFEFDAIPEKDRLLTLDYMRT